MHHGGQKRSLGFCWPGGLIGACAGTASTHPGLVESLHFSLALLGDLLVAALDALDDALHVQVAAVVHLHDDRGVAQLAIQLRSLLQEPTRVRPRPPRREAGWAPREGGGSGRVLPQHPGGSPGVTGFQHEQARDPWGAQRGAAARSPKRGECWRSSWLPGTRRFWPRQQFLGWESRSSGPRRLRPGRCWAGQGANAGSPLGVLVKTCCVLDRSATFTEIF